MALVFNRGYTVMVVALPHSLINRNEKGYCSYSWLLWKTVKWSKFLPL